MNIPVSLVVIAVLVAFSAFFSGTEIAYTSVRPQRISDRYEKKKSLSLRYAVYFLSHFDDMLAAILIGNNVVNQAASAIAAMIVIELLGENFSWVSTLAMTVLVLIFGEVLPKSICKAKSELICAVSAVPLHSIAVIFKPLIFLVNRLMDVLARLWEPLKPSEEPITEGELSSVMDIVGSEGVIDEEHTTLVKRAIDYKDIRAYEIITPRVDMEYIDINDSGESILDLALTSKFSRLPVCGGDADSVLGVLHLNKLLFKLESGDLSEDSDISDAVRSLMNQPIFVPKTTPVHRVVETMRERQQQMVFVVDEHGGVMGLVTMEDALEVLVGDIWDETDEVAPDIVKLDGGGYDLGSQTRLRELFSELSVDFDTDEIVSEYTVLGGWCAEMLGMSPKVGDSFSYNGLVFTVRTLNDRLPDRITLSFETDENGKDADK